MSGNAHVDVMLAGAAAAFTVDLMIYPLDTLKTRIQAQDYLRTLSPSSSSSSSSSSSPATSSPASSSSSSTTSASGVKTSRTAPSVPTRQLFRGLYQGIGIVVIATVPAAGTFFTVYEASKGFLARLGSSSSGGGGGSVSNGAGGSKGPLINSAASAIAECASCLVLTPAEVIKQNAQMLSSSSSSSSSSSPPSKPSPNAAPSPTASTSLQALRNLGGKHAGRKLLSGYTALVARNLPFTALQFPVFEAIRERIWDHRRAQKGGDGSGSGKRGLLETGIVTGLSAGSAGSVAAFITTPMDVVKTRMMLSAGGGGGDGGGDGSSNGQKKGGEKRSSGPMSVSRDILAERGVKGFFRGAALRSVWTAVGSGLYLGMYEVSKTWLTGDGESGGKGKEREGL